MCLFFLLFFVVIYGVQVIGDENLGNIQSGVGINVKEGVCEVFVSDNWIMNLLWNFFGYVIIIIFGVFIICMFKNLNFNERSGKFKGLCICVLIVNFVVQRCQFIVLQSFRWQLVIVFDVNSCVDVFFFYVWKVVSICLKIQFFYIINSF